MNHNTHLYINWTPKLALNWPIQHDRPFLCLKGKKPPLKHQLSRRARIIGSMTPPMGFLEEEKKREKMPPPHHGGEGGGGLTNERPGSDHVIWGPMRSLHKINLNWRRTFIHTYIHTYAHGDLQTNLAERGWVGENSGLSESLPGYF